MRKKKDKTTKKHSIADGMTVLRFSSKAARRGFYICVFLFALMLLGAMASTIRGETNWLMWIFSGIFGCISCAIWIFKGKIEK